MDRTRAVNMRVTSCQLILEQWRRCLTEGRGQGGQGQTLRNTHNGEVEEKGEETVGEIECGTRRTQIVSAVPQKLREGVKLQEGKGG